VRDINLGAFGSYPSRLTNVEGTLLFRPTTGRTAGSWKVVL